MGYITALIYDNHFTIDIKELGIFFLLNVNIFLKVHLKKIKIVNKNSMNYEKISYDWYVLQDCFIIEQTQFFLFTIKS